MCSAIARIIAFSREVTAGSFGSRSLMTPRCSALRCLPAANRAAAFAATSQHRRGADESYRFLQISWQARVLIGTDDVDHPRELDVRIADWLNENGAKADFWFLGDRGVSGNGPMMMIESNSDDLAKLILSWVEGGVTGSTPR